MTSKRTSEGEIASEVILSTFRTNGALLAAGDVLAAEFGLTSARWQVLGAIALPEQPLTVPQIARRMGLARQSVHSTVSRLLADGLVELIANADHRRSQLVRLTDRGRATVQAIDDKQAAWVNQLVAGLSGRDLETTERVLDELCTRLEASRRVPDNHEGDTQ
jgi:DNA-binding MarR family transcriptional regulator